MDRTVFEAAESGDLNRIKGLEHLDRLLMPEGNTVLHVAVWFDNKRFAEQALRQCPSLLLKPNEGGETPLHAAAKNPDPEMARLLLDFASRGDIESSDDQQKTVLNCGCAMTTLLRARSAAKGDTALHVSVRHGHFAVAELLIDADVRMLEMLNGAGESPLFLAVEGGFLDIARYIIIDKCRGFLGPRVFDGSHGMNALHAAVIRIHHGNFSSVRTFIFELYITGLCVYVIAKKLILVIIFLWNECDICF